MAAPLKPLVHWAIYKGYKIRYTDRASSRVKGVLTTDSGTVEFTYEPTALRIVLPDSEIRINEFGWEVSQDAQEND